MLALTALFPASAQISMDLSLDQDEFLPNEAIRVTVKISNTSGQELHLGVDPRWLTFSVEADDDVVVVKNQDVPVVEPFDLESSQRAIKHVDLQPYFQLGRPGRYKVTATLRIPQWYLTVNSAPIHFDVIHGGELWTQNFGVMVDAHSAPEPRKYSLIKANFLREQLRLYLQVSSADGSEVFKVAPLGPLVSFSEPEEEVDRFSRLHVLWQTGARSYTYVIVDPDGAIASRDGYDNFGSHPHLSVGSNGDVVVNGGVLRPKVSDLPTAVTASPAPAGATNH